MTKQTDALVDEVKDLVETFEEPKTQTDVDKHVKAVIALITASNLERAKSAIMSLPARGDMRRIALQKLEQEFTEVDDE